MNNIVANDVYDKKLSNVTLEPPAYASITNKYILQDNKAGCNPFKAHNYFGEYLNSCNNPSVMWGSNKPVKEQNPTEYIDHSGTPCHSLWNNSTRRKIIVNK